MRIKIPSMTITQWGPVEKQEREWLAVASPGTDVYVTPAAAKGPESIECVYDVAMCTPWLLEEVRKAEEEGFDAVIIPCMGDPGLYAAREAVSIPVVGPCEISMHLAAMLGHKFSIMEPLREGVGLSRQILLTYGLERFLASTRVLDLTVDEIWADREKLRDAIVREGKAAVEEDGAEVIVLGCGFMSGMTKELEGEIRVPVIDPWAAAMAFAEMLVRLGLTHSKKAYMIPRPKRIEV